MRTAPLLALLAPSLLAACASHGEKTDSSWSSPVDALRAANPSDIAILPAIDGTAEGTARAATPKAVPLERFQQAAYREFLKRRYAPLALDYVERAWRGASGASAEKGRCDEDAYLRIWVTRFDASRLATADEIRVAADFLLNDGKTGAELWSAKADRRISLKDEAEILRDEALLRRAAVERFVAQALQGLPARAPAVAGP